MKLCSKCGDPIDDEEGIETDSDFCFWCSDRSDNADQYYEPEKGEKNEDNPS